MKFFNKNVLIAGFAMFSMFFGSGNLVFPIAVGVTAVDQYSIATLGLLVTAILMPFIGLLGISLFDGDRRAYFSCLGEKPALVITLIILGLMGPIGVAPRCVMVAFDGFTQLVPNATFPLFSFIFCLVIAVIIIRKRRFMDIMGAFLTPILLVSIIIIIVAGLFFVDRSFYPGNLPFLEAFNIGFNQGYLTMDLLAAFFFSATAVQYIKASAPDGAIQKSIFKQSILASMIGAGLLGGIYIGFVMLGAKFMPQLQGVDPGKMLFVIAHESLGSLAVPVVGATFVLACLTTASILVLLFSDFLYQDLFKERISRKLAVFITLLMTFGTSLFGFIVLSQWLGFMLQILYPALITLAVSNVFNKLYGFKKVNAVFYSVLALSALWKLSY